ncbi:hypothetical protein CONLIGDRAFT_226403 [Coniochaeta ligniaria NRRL 30616]|uniref:Uncharacterized protein n=1 Tax=Coniochaeta ligniaria NRRL 30616 TaxID=1408157 RepID=A0A1J7IZN3_9PEZI|nr:hypothetical protein CONLIGDRAFT_226403 [Coniochaeta ligniaria NRRL 30616]
MATKATKATKVPEPKLKKGNVIKFPTITTPMPKKDGLLRKRLYGNARTINKIDLDEMEVEDLKTMVFFGWELVSFFRVNHQVIRGHPLPRSPCVVQIPDGTVPLLWRFCRL